MKTFVITLIKLYQKTLSLDHGWFRARYPHGFCRFYPSCSDYGIEAVSNHGVIKGLIKTLFRIIRCNPWTQPHIDHAN
jgi:uncharacterized protein